MLPLLFSCDNDSDKQMIDYYVRYEYNLTFGPSYGSQYYDKTITVNTDSGIKEFTTINNSFSETFGPVKKGFKASISVKSENGSSGTTNLRIYVSRGGEPFVLKATNESYLKTASYTIDY